MSDVILKRGFFAFVMAVAVVCLLVGCGNETTSGDLIEAAPLESLGELDPTEELIFSDEYAGYLVLHVDESLGARVDASSKAIVSRFPLLYKEGRGEVGPLPSLSLPYKGRELSTLASIQKTIESHPLAEFKRVIKASPDAADKRRAELEKLSGKKLADMNSILRIDVTDPAEAVKLYRELKNLEGVDKIYPYQKGHPTSIDDVPDLTPYQGYLYSNETHGGLNAQAAWDAGVHGEGVLLIESETDWSFAHEDLPIRDPDPTDGFIPRYLTVGLNCRFPESAPFCPGAMNHGTGMVGVMAGLDNGHGVKGFAHASDVYVTMGAGGDLLDWSDGEGDGELMEELPPGTIFVRPIGYSGALSDPGSGSDYGGLPYEAIPISFGGVSQATAAGIIVITPAANGSIDLGNPTAYYPDQVNVSLNDSGSIVVGSSWGALLPHQRRADSNCGSRVNVYAWGNNVVTTGFQHSSHPYIWDPGLLPDGFSFGSNENNNYFINNFGGTSAAGAMIAGAVALIQSYAKREFAELGGSESLAATRYLMPLKMREILVNSGVPQVGGGCNIGTQPRVDVAMTLVDAFVTETRAAYPEIETGEMMTEERMIAMRRAGLGIICRPADVVHHSRTGDSDIACPEIDLWPTGNYIAKDLDFDGDGRADLVQWTNGTWKLDLSSRGSGGDNFGAWDIEIAHPPISGQWVWPYVNDMNSDGRTDFVAYDKEHGRWLISFTDTPLVNNGTWHGWDLILDYGEEWHDELKLRPLDCTTGTGPNCTNYSRPAIGDYDGDGWNDVAIAASDGYWRIDHDVHTLVETQSTGVMTRVFDQSVRYLSDEQLALAPGWAYTTSPYNTNPIRMMAITYKYPDGIPDEGRVVSLPPAEFDFDDMEGQPHIYGGGENILISAKYERPDYAASSYSFGVKRQDGTWPISYLEAPDYYFRTLSPVAPDDIFGDSSCRPVVADFDGDDQTDRVVMCPDGWRIAYSSDDLFTTNRDTDDARRIPLGYDTNIFSIPGRTYSGGISYGQVRRLIEFFQRTHPDTPPPIPVDMP